MQKLIYSLFLISYLSQGQATGTATIVGEKKSFMKLLQFRNYGQQLPV
jgi:hypothetical protein